MKTTHHPVDIHVGQRVKILRKLKGITQQTLAQRLAITFQQVQKYERGENRISASKLWEIAGVLGTNVAYFYDGVPSSDIPNEDNPWVNVDEFLATESGAVMALNFPKLKPKVQREITQLVLVLSESV